MATIKKTTKELINANNDIQLEISVEVLGEALALLDKKPPKFRQGGVGIGPRLRLYSPSQMIDRIIVNGSSIGSIWKHLTAHYNQHPYWLTVSPTPAQSFRTEPYHLAIIGFDHALDHRVLGIVKDYLFDGTLLSAPAFRTLERSQIERVCLRHIAKQAQHETTEKELPRL